MGGVVYAPHGRKSLYRGVWRGICGDVFCPTTCVGYAARGYEECCLQDEGMVEFLGRVDPVLRSLESCGSDIDLTGMTFAHVFFVVLHLELDLEGDMIMRI